MLLILMIDMIAKWCMASASLPNKPIGRTRPIGPRGSFTHWAPWAYLPVSNGLNELNELNGCIGLIAAIMPIGPMGSLGSLGPAQYAKWVWRWM